VISDETGPAVTAIQKAEFVVVLRADGSASEQETVRRLRAASCLLYHSRHQATRPSGLPQHKPQPDPPGADGQKFLNSREPALVKPTGRPVVVAPAGPKTAENEWSCWSRSSVASCINGKRIANQCLGRQQMEAKTEPVTTETRLLVDARQASAMLGISERTLWTITKRREIAVVRLGSRVQYRPQDLAEFIARRTTPSTEA
jgi:hypothetical protein